MPKRSISPAAFDAILSELGDDPSIIHSKRNQHSNANQDKSTMNRHPYETDAMRLPNQFPHQDAQNSSDPLGTATEAYLQRLADKLSSNEKRIWLGLMVCLCANAALNTYLIYEWRADVDLKLHAPQRIDSEVQELKEILLRLQADVEDGHGVLFDFIDNETLHHAKRVHSTVPLRSSQQPTKPSLTELTLKRWRYLGMSESGSGIKGFFDTGSSVQTLALNSTAMGDWMLTSITRESAGLSTTKGKSISLYVSKE